MDFFCDKQHPVVPVTLLFIQRERFVLLEGDAFIEGLRAFVALRDEVETDTTDVDTTFLTPCAHGMSATPLEIKGSEAYIICHPQLPNSQSKKIAIKFTDEKGEGYDVYDYNKDVEYTNIRGQYQQSLGPALIKNIESIYPTIKEMIAFTDKFHE